AVAVADVEAAAAVPRLADGGMEVVRPVEQPAALGRVDVGEDVAGLQVLDDLVDRFGGLLAPGLADVHHQPRAELIGQAARLAQRLQAERSHGAADGVYLDPDDAVAVGLQDAGDAVGVDQAGVGQVGV